MTTTRKLLLLDSKLAELIGDKEAIVLCQLNYWIENNKKKRKNYLEGKYWVFSSIDNWQENNFPFWSKDKVRRIFNSLVSKDYVFTKKFYQNKNNQTKSYTINYLKLQKDFNFNFITEKDNNIQKKHKNNDKPYNSPFMQNDNSTYAKLQVGNMQSAQMQGGILPKSLKENNKKINTNIINTAPTSYTYYSDDDLLKVGGVENINFKNISLESFSGNDIALAKSIVNLMKESTSKDKIFNISGQKLNSKDLYEKFKFYGDSEVKYVIDVMREAENIKYPRAFMLNILYHADSLMEIYYENKANNFSGQDFYSDDYIQNALDILEGD